ncbi:DUF3948 family protein, partial [Klebsiella pneumoniae]|nr:DUF3948 family protein [Klebsiella pneumoniae]
MRNMNSEQVLQVTKTDL